MKSYSDFQECFKGIKSTMNKVAMLAMMIVSFTTVVTSCSNNDNVPTSYQPSVLAESIVGEWIVEQDNQFALLYHFYENGTGWKEFAILANGEVDSFPICRYETEFNYLVSDLGKVILNFTDADGEMTGEKAELLFDGKTLTDKIKEMSVALSPSTEAQINKYKSLADAWYGGSDEMIVDLSKVKEHFTAVDGMTLTGNLVNACKISIADGATITLDNASIIGDENYHLVDAPNGSFDEVTNAWSGLTCIGDATIIISGSNIVQGFDHSYPGIFIPEGRTLTIRGDGSLTAKPNLDDLAPGYGKPYAVAGAGIGGGIEGEYTKCGNIIIESGNITAIGGGMAAGIGSTTAVNQAYTPSCGNITIMGGNVTATGGQNAAAIGSGAGDRVESHCGNIYIEGATVVATAYGRSAAIGCGYNSWCGNIDIKDSDITATRGEDDWGQYCIGSTLSYTNKCGTVTIDGMNYSVSFELRELTFHYQSPSRKNTTR